MLVLITQDLEDANVFARDEEGFDTALNGGHAPTKFPPEVTYLDDAEQEAIMVRRVDMLQGGKVYDLPPKQAQSLIDQGLATDHA